MAGKKVKGRAESGRAGKVLCAMVMFSVMVLLGFVLFAPPESGTAMASFRGVLTGLGGWLAVGIPLVFGWLGALCVLKAAGRPVKVWKCVFDGVVIVSVYTAVHVFVAEYVIKNHMAIQTFANFVNKSYVCGKGGGAIGALLAWPLYGYLGKWGGFLASLLLAVLCLTATGRLQRFMDRVIDMFEKDGESEQPAPAPKKTKRMFDSEFEEPLPERKKKRRPMDPKSDDLMHKPAEGKKAGRRANVSMIDDEPFMPSDFEPVVDTKFTPDRSKTVEEKMAKKRRVTAEEAVDLFSTDEPVSPAPAPKKKPAAKVVEEGVRAVTLDEPTEAPKKKKKKAEEAVVDDLTIEPDVSDVLENDDPPFDMPDKKPVKPLKKLKRPAPRVEPEEEEYNYPPIDLLAQGENIKENHRDSDMQKAQLLEDTLKQFGISTKLTGIAHGPAVTRFELQPAPGVKVSRITSLADDIAMHLAAMSVRIEAPIPGKAAVGVEIPNEKVEMVRLRDVLESPEARKSVSKIAVGLGKDNAGRYIVADIAKMPHVLIAGQTGSGKSVCINSIIASILFRATPEEVRLILIDPKMVELSVYNEIPHLVCPVVTDCKKAASALDWAVAEMEMRYKRFSERGVRDIKGYNKALKEDEKPMPQMVIIIDELADLMMVAPGEVEDSICRLAQLARAAGMHLVIATQRPSVNVITGIIKANIPTRIAFSVASQVDSRTMIDHGGAEKLLGNGDMLFVPSGINKPMRVQGAWVSDEEVHAITEYIKERSETSYDADMIEKMDNAARTDAEKEEFSAEYDPRLPEAVEIVVEAGQASVSMLQRRMRVGYARAGRLIDEMEQRGIVSEADGAKPRTVLITREEMNELFAEED